jgi:hypothetical protein
MESWDVDLLRERDCIVAVMDRARSVDRYRRARREAQPMIEALRQTTQCGLNHMRGLIEQVGSERETEHEHS